MSVTWPVASDALVAGQSNKQKETTVGIDDLVDKGKEFLEQNKDKINDALQSEQAESMSDAALDAGANLVKKLAPDEHDTTIDAVRSNLDKSVGSE